MGLFDDVLRSDQTIVKNVDALDYEFLPKILPYRENQQVYLATCIKPLLRGLSGRNLFIYGAPGIGKTAAARAVIRELEEQTDEIEIILINCWKNNTTYKIMLEMCDVLGYKFTQNKKTVELFKVVSSILNKKAAVLIFDEIDQVEDFDFLYFVLEEIHKKSIFLITNYREFLVEIDERIKSRLLPEMLEFKPYTEKETKDILKARVDVAFFPGVWQNDAFEIVAKKAGELKDIRTGIFLLKESALQAEEKSQKKITLAHVLAATSKLDEFTIKNTGLLEEETKMIFDLVKENSGKKIGDLFKIFQKKGGVSSYKTFQRKIAKLEDGKFIKTQKQMGVGGNTTIVEKTLKDF
ncbi:MAG: AAA family ATPase [Candidatus Woesearchaeota archaeon]|jgi:Cdc6-like AAA superfamily ATPase